MIQRNMQSLNTEKLTLRDGIITVLCQRGLLSDASLLVLAGSGARKPLANETIHRCA
jgi:hypothetical protein